MSFIYYNIKLIFRNKVVLIVFGISILIFLLLVGNLTNHAEERSSIPVAVIDKDRSDLSSELVNKIKESESLYVYATDKDTADKLFYNHKITAIYVIKNGYEKDIIKGKYKGLIEVHYLSENKSITILSDIIAGYMMHDICLRKSIRVYQTVHNDQSINLANNYKAFVDQYLRNDIFNFRFDIEFKNIKSDMIIKTDGITNSLIYKQAIGGMISLILSFIVMFMVFGIVQAQHKLSSRPLKIAKIPSFLLWLYQYITSILVMSLLSLIFAIIISINSNNGNNLNQVYFLWFIIIVFSMVMTIIFLLLGKLLKNGTSYQAVGSLIVLSFGFLGCAGIILGGHNSVFLLISKFIPNYWFIEKLTDIIVSGIL